MDEALLVELEKLREENSLLKARLATNPSPSVVEQIRAAICAKAMELEPEPLTTRRPRATIKHRIMDDLKWHLHVRYTQHFNQEHLGPALEFIRNWKPEVKLTNLAI